MKAVSIIGLILALAVIAAAPREGEHRRPVAGDSAEAAAVPSSAAPASAVIPGNGPVAGNAEAPNAGPRQRPDFSARAGERASPIALSPLPEQYAVLLTRSIFSRGGVAASPPDVRNVPGPGPDMGPRLFGGAEQGPTGPDETLALRGVVNADSQYIAFIEDTTSHRTYELRPGDSLGHGRIEGMTLDELGYEADGRVNPVRVGENLAGAELPPATQPSTGPQPGPGSQPTTMPAGMPNFPPGFNPAMMQMAPDAARAAFRANRGSRRFRGGGGGPGGPGPRQ